MKRLLLLPMSLAWMCLSPGSASHAQTTTDGAKADGKAFGREKAADAQKAATTGPDASRVPNFGGVPGQADYFDDPERMSREAASQANSSAGYRTMRDSMDRRARFAPQDLDAVIARSKALSEDPLAYTSGFIVGGSQGRCVPLPAGTASAGRYMATCDTGYTASQETRTCRVTLEASVTPGTAYVYRCSSDVFTGDLECSVLPSDICTRTRRLPFRCIDWTWLAARVLALRTGRGPRNLFVTDHAKAAAILESLEKDGSRLRSAVGQLRHRFRET